jgi:hypothetical protein
VDNEITVSWLGNFGVRPFWGPGDYPIWESSDTVRQPHFSNLSQPPPGTLTLRWRWGDDTGQYSMLEYDMPDPPPGTHQFFVGLDPPTPPYVEIQADLNVGPTVPGGPDMMYWRLMATAGAFLGLWWADTREWHENPVPAPPTPTRQWTDELLRAPSATWWAITAVYETGGGPCPPLPRPPWPYTDALTRLGQLGEAKRRLMGARRVNGTAAQLETRIRVDLARLRQLAARFENGSAGTGGLHEALSVSADLARARAELDRARQN